MAEIFEVRRHSLRGSGPGLSPEGIALAQQTAPTLVGRFAAAYTSPKQRAIETLAAFGFTAYTVVPEFSTLPATLAAHDHHVDALVERTQCSVLDAYMAIPATHLILEAFGAACLDKLCTLAAKLPHGRNAIAVSHGGSIEPAVLAAMPDWTLESMGGELAECEGALFHFDGGVFRGVDIVRR